MSTLRRFIISPIEDVGVSEYERSFVVNPLPARDSSAAVWRRVNTIIQRRIAMMEANLDKATDEWGAEQGLSRAEWEVRIRNYTCALEELHKLADDIVASQSEIP